MTAEWLRLNGILVANSASLAEGMSIAISGLVIVFSALLLISLFIACLPRILSLVAQFWPEVDEPHAELGHPESHVPDDTAVLAAIGFVLHTELQQLGVKQPVSSGKH